jgi:hypothetical protein
VSLRGTPPHPARRRALAAPLAWATLPAAWAAAPAQQSLPPAVVAATGELRRLGSGTMRWFGLHVYDAALWVRGTRWVAEEPFALDIVYARDIAGRALAESSLTEIRRVGQEDPARSARWLETLQKLFPDVSRGDRLIGAQPRPGVASFWLGDRPLGSVEDPGLTRAFFAIWLDPKTREPQLRQRLLGPA